MSLLLAVLFSAGLLGLFAYYKARTCLSFPHHSLTYRTPGPAQSRAHNDDVIYSPVTRALNTAGNRLFAFPTIVKPRDEYSDFELV